LASTNRFQGLARGPIDHNASSVINAIAGGPIVMGSAVVLDPVIPVSELLPRVEEAAVAAITNVVYGIAVGGDTDGIYANTSSLIITPTDAVRATTGEGQGVVVVTQGRCVARVLGAATLVIGDSLSPSTTAGILTKATTTSIVIARALSDVTNGDLDLIAVDVQREGIF